MIPLMAMVEFGDAVELRPDVRAAAELLFSNTCSVNLGRACNLACAYCSVSDDLPLAADRGEIESLIAGVRRAGYRSVAFIGGEPTTHPNFLELADYAAHQGLSHRILVTNGVKLADPEFARRVLGGAFDVVNISLDVFDKTIQEQLFGGKERYRAVLRGLMHVLASGVEVVLSAVVNRANVSRFAAYPEVVARLQRRYRRRIPVLALLMHEARPSAGAEALYPRFEDAVSGVRGMLARADALGVTAMTFGFPPCLLEDEAAHAAELYAREWMLDVDSGALETTNLYGGGVYVRACTTCRCVNSCRGLLPRYATQSVTRFIDQKHQVRPASTVIDRCDRSPDDGPQERDLIRADVNRAAAAPIAPPLVALIRRTFEGAPVGGFQVAGISLRKGDARVYVALDPIAPRGEADSPSPRRIILILDPNADESTPLFVRAGSIGISYHGSTPVDTLGKRDVVVEFGARLAAAVAANVRSAAPTR